MNIQWYPGHMTKTRRMIAEQIKNVDAVCEILDARIPVSSQNPDVDELTAGKPRMVVLNRVDQADPEGTKRWAEHFRAKGYAVLESDAKSGVGTAKFAGAVRELLADKLREETEEYLQSRKLEDLADILEVLRALARAGGATPRELELARRAKARTRGGFKERIVMSFPGEVVPPGKSG